LMIKELNYVLSIVDDLTSINEKMGKNYIIQIHTES